MNAQYYSELLSGRLREKLKECRLGKLHHRTLLQQDNARPHTARHTKQTLADLKWELLPHPPYSSDLAPSDYHLFPALKKQLRGTHFKSLNEIKRAVNQRVKSTPPGFFEEGIKNSLIVDKNIEA